MWLSVLLIAAAIVAAPEVSATPDALQSALDARTSALAGTGIVVDEVGESSSHVLTSGLSGTTRPLDENSVFEIGSVTKTFTATMLASMVLDGSVRLDDPVQRYLPATVHVPSFAGREITLLDLATQHSGLPRMADFQPPDASDPYAAFDTNALYAFLNSYKLTRTPGADFEYSNVGIALLGQALSNRAGVPYFQLLKQRVLDPLGMHDTTIGLSRDQRARFTVGRDVDGNVVKPWTFEAAAPAGALRSTLADLRKYARCYLGLGPLAATCAFAAKPQATFPGNQIGLVWWTGDEHHILHHGGDTAGYHASIAISPDRTRAAIVLANGGMPVEDIAGHVLATDIGILPPPDAATIRISAEALDGYAGTYGDASMGTLVVERTENGLSMAIAGQPMSAMYPTGNDTFVSHAAPVRFKFTRDARGNVNALVLLQDGQTGVFVRPGMARPSDADTAMFPAAATLDAATLASYPGDYTSDIGTFRIALAAGRLSVKLNNQAPVTMTPSAKDAFFVEAVDATAEFSRDPAGLVTAMTFHQAGITIVATRARRGSAGAAEPAPPDGHAIYLATLKAMSQIVEPAYVVFQSDLIITCCKKREEIYWRVQERTSDHFGRSRGIGVDGRDTDDLDIRRMKIAPDYFIPRRSAPDSLDDATGEPGLKTIADTPITNYTFAVIDDNAVADCPDTYHLRLTPKSDPDRFRLRDLWIDKAGYRICHARVAEEFYIVQPVTVIADLFVNRATGMVSQLSFNGTGNYHGRPINAEILERYTPPVATTIDDKLFEGKH